MSSTNLSTRPPNDAAIMERAVIEGDLANLTDEQRLTYYGRVCESVGLNPLTKPFAYLRLNDKLVLYATRDATDQLRRLHAVNVQIVSRETIEGVYIVTARATDSAGRSDESIGAVSLVKEDGEWKTAISGKRYFQGNGTYKPLQGDERANAIMKAESKSKRRVTLSFCGLGWLDETEIETIPGGVRVASTDQGAAHAAVATVGRQPGAPTVAAGVQHDGAVIAAAASVTDPWRAELIERYQRVWDEIKAASGRPPRAPREVDARVTADALQEQVDAGERWLAAHQGAQRADEMITPPAMDDAPLTESEVLA